MSRDNTRLMNGLRGYLPRSAFWGSYRGEPIN